MHLKYDNPLFRRVFLFGLVLAVIVFIIVLFAFEFWSADYLKFLRLSDGPRPSSCTRWVPHPEVWVLVGGLVVLYAYAGRVIGPKVVPAGTPAVTRSQRRWFAVGILLLWAAADWPVHDIGEEYLYFVHMIQHLVLMLVVPPIMLLATPEWLARLVVGDGRVNAGVRRLARPVPAGALFDAAHPRVALAGDREHRGRERALPLRRARRRWSPRRCCSGSRCAARSPSCASRSPAQMIYLFVASLVPTVPGAWMIFADGAVYSAYDIPARLWGISVTSDQQVAGAIMKLVGGTYLWVIITGLFFRWAGRPGAGATGPSVLTWDQVQQEFDEHPAPTAGGVALTAPSAAASRAAMSSFCIRSIASIARLARAGSASVKSASQPAGHDLPGQAELVLQPAALAVLAAVAELVPVVVDLVLVGAADLERDRLVEGELRAAVDDGERLPVELEAHGEHRAGRSPGRPRRSG